MKDAQVTALLKMANKNTKRKYQDKHYLSVIAKLVDSNIVSLSSDELNKVFSETVSPSICKNIAEELIEAGLTIDLLSG